MKITAPAIPHDLTNLTDVRKMFIQDGAVTNVHIVGSNLSGIKVKLMAISESKLEKVDFTAANLEKFIIRDSMANICNFAGVNFSDSGWRYVQINDSRCSGAQFQMSSLKNTVFQNCRLDLSNFRYAKLENILFKDCFMNDTDFYSAQLKNVEFDNCIIEKIEFSGAKLEKVDLSTSELRIIQGVSSMKGAIINSLQLTSLSAYFAQELGIVVKADI